MMDVDPSGWEWHVAAEEEGAAAGGAGSRSVLRTVLTVLSFLAWTAAGAAAASTLGLPLARIDALSTPMALLAGEIGRASCRERVWRAVVQGLLISDEIRVYTGKVRVCSIVGVL